MSASLPLADSSAVTHPLYVKREELSPSHHLLQLSLPATVPLPPSRTLLPLSARPPAPGLTCLGALLPPGTSCCKLGITCGLEVRITQICS
jgi:hypothetical protein